MIEAMFFYVFSAVLLLSGLMVVTARNPVHAVLFLILAFFNAAGLFVMLGAEFIAMIMVIVYVGAVAVLFLFVVMMLDIDFAGLRAQMKKHLPVGLLVGGALGFELLWLYYGWRASDKVETGVAHPSPEGLTNTHALGQLLYTEYAYLFQVSGLILLVAMIGAITLTHRGRGDVRRQDISKQVRRDPKDVIRIEKIASGAGVA
jgi:NADH-quinone oxidoreductase subunit J